MAEDKTIPVVVVVRARPFVPRETDEGSSSCLEFEQADNQICISGRPFCFDHVFDHETDQQIVYELCAEPLIDKFFRGYNCTIFAYGQTGSGKTFTMGTESSSDPSDGVEKGIIPRTVEAIFHRIKNSGDDSVVVKCSMLEIYEERVIDLLSEMREKPELFIREHPEEGIFVQNLSQLVVRDFPETLRRLQQGCFARTKGETAMNAKSSRSHAIFTLYIKHSLNEDSPGGTFCQAKLHLVDLAGSERLKKTQAVGERQKEGIKINEGLLALGNVISALTDTTQQRSHIPYRDSRLTRLLQDSLGGNTYTVMIACISPADSNYDETLSTLRYAERAKKIKNKPRVNLDANAKELARLRLELDEAKRQILACQTGSGSTPFLNYGDQAELQNLRQLHENLTNENQSISSQLTQITVEHAMFVEKAASIECQRDKLKEKLVDLQQEIDQQANGLNSYANDPSMTHQSMVEMCIENYHQLRRKLNEIQSVDASMNEEGSFDRENDDLEEFDENHFRSRQNAASRELQNLLKKIQDKEKLLKESAQNSAQMEQLKINHQKEMADLNGKIEVIQKEREEFEKQLECASKSSKVSEARRKRMAEMEKQIGDYRKKISELQKFEKIKAQCDQNMSKMGEEMLALKQQRVQLVKQLRNDNQRFKEWQLKAEKQLNQMKVKEKRRENEAVIAKRKFDQQLTVHRRKYEEAVAFSKRLQNQLQRQNFAKKDHFTEMQENDKLIKDVKEFLEKEIELIASTEEAKLHCDNLLKQRKQLNVELQKCEKKYEKMLKESSKAKPTLDGRSRYSEAEDMQIRIESLRQEIGLSTNEIKELRQKITSVDTNQVEDRRWTGINSLLHAKCALKQLFTMAVNTRVDFLQSEHQLSDEKMENDLLANLDKQKDNKIYELDQLLVEKDKQLQEDLSRADSEYNNKLSVLLQHFVKLASGQLTGDEIGPIIQMYCNDAEKLQSLTEQLEKKTTESEHLTKELSKAKVRNKAANGGNFFSDVLSKKLKRKSGNLEGEEANSVPTKLKRSRSSRVIRQPQLFGRQIASSELTAINSSDEDHSKVEQMVEDEDSDYRNTPFYKRTQKLTKGSDGPSLIGQKKPRISSMSASACACKRGNCLSICGCSRKGKKCSSQCGCSRQLCCNRLDVPEVTSPREIDEFENKSQEDNSPKKTANLNETFVMGPAQSSAYLTSTPIDQQAPRGPEDKTKLAPPPPFFQIATPTFAVPLLGQGLTRNFSPKPRTGGSLFTPLTPSARKYFGGGV